ncbi:unnamed protein product [Rhizophagus irregularis]|uniref:Uncharacterized protein n=1 Tax=Rhizophagus irregularis TaxID=588596 RepID=A0A915ZK34_9GLOM|nr:unnamed protein product [Rhizophagus irregularis]
MKPYDTSYNRLKFVLALIILRNKPVDWKIEDYIQFINRNDVQQNNLNEITQNVKEKISNDNKEKQNNQEVSNSNNAIVDEHNNSQLRWRKRALELANNVDSLKQQLCLVELELENAKQSTVTNKRKKTRVQQSNSISGTVEGDIFSKKQSEKRSSAKRELNKYQDPDVQIFQKLPGADDTWGQFDINQAMSFLQQIKLLMSVATTMSEKSTIEIHSPSLELSSTNSRVMIAQTIIKIVHYMSIKLTSLLEIFQANALKSSNLKRTYSTCVNNFGTVLEKLLVFLESPLLSDFEKNNIISTIATSLTFLIQAIHILTTVEIEELMRESSELEDIDESEISSEIQDPRDVITFVLIHVCNEIEPRLKEAVCFVAAKECLQLIIKEFNMYKESTTDDTYSFINTIMSNIGSGKPVFEPVSSIVCKDTTYYLLWILEEVLIKNQGCKPDNVILLGETIKNITTLLEASILNNRRTSSHGDAFTMYLYNICEKLCVQLGSISLIDLLEKLFE